MAVSTETKVFAGVITVAAVAAGVYFATRVEAAPPREYCCPYCGQCFATYEELVQHVQTAHPDERIPIPIEWD